MSLGHSIGRIFACGLAFALAAGFCHSAPAQTARRGSSIQFSEPKSTEISTNLSQLGGKRDNLMQLEDALSKSLPGFSSKGSLDGTLAPAIRPVPRPVIIPNK